MNAVISMNSLVQSAVISVGLSPLGVNPYEQRGHLLLAEKINQVTTVVNTPTQNHTIVVILRVIIAVRVRLTALGQTAVINLWVLYISLCFFGLEILRGLTGGAAGTCGTPPGAVIASNFCVQLSRFGSSARSLALFLVIHSDQRGCLKNRVKVFVILSTTLNIYLTAY